MIGRRPNRLERAGRVSGRAESTHRWPPRAEDLRLLTDSPTFVPVPPTNSPWSATRWSTRHGRHRHRATSRLSTGTRWSSPAENVEVRTKPRRLGLPAVSARSWPWSFPEGHRRVPHRSRTQRADCPFRRVPGRRSQLPELSSRRSIDALPDRLHEVDEAAPCGSATLLVNSAR